ncbi:MAG: outer membrane beta-barrel protein [Flavisolibacter sp.]
MLRKFTLSAIVMSACNGAFSQDSTQTAALSISGSADLYYKFDFGKSKSNNLTSFTHSHNSFELGMASVKLDYKAANVEMVADFGLGKRAQEFCYNDEGILQGVKQLYISYSPNNWLKLTGGSWATHVGYELLDAYANRNYSMSYMFTNGPFFHTGIKAEVTYKSNGLMIGIANPTDFKYVPDGFISKKFLIAQYSYTPGDYFKAYFNYVAGQNVDTTKSKQYDIVFASKLSSKLGLGYNGTYNRTKTYLGNKIYDKDKSWWGSALYINFDASDRFGLTLREEYFSDKDGLKMYSTQPVGGNVFASTLSVNLKVDNLVFIPEFRLDKASQPIFLNKNNNSTKTAVNILFAAVYQF